MIISFFRGYQIECKNTKWIYSDTKKLVSETYKNRPCGNCKQFATKEDHDACIGELPGVMNACCGHGNIDQAYIQFLDKSIIRGKKAQLYLMSVKNEEQL